MGQERKGSTGLGGTINPIYKSSSYTGINNMLQKGIVRYKYCIDI